jgi:hypothetical protein
MASTSKKSWWYVPTKTSNRRRTWSRGVPTPWNLSVFPPALHVRSLQVLCLTNPLPLRMHAAPPRIPSLDLSKATKLKAVVLQCASPNLQWAATTLQTIESENLQRITIDMSKLENLLKETVHQTWLDLDRLLLQFSESHSIRPEIILSRGRGRTDFMNLMPILLPELTRRGIVDVVERIR